MFPSFKLDIGLILFCFGCTFLLDSCKSSPGAVTTVDAGTSSGGVASGAGGSENTNGTTATGASSFAGGRATGGATHAGGSSATGAAQATGGSSATGGRVSGGASAGGAVGSTGGNGGTVIMTGGGGGTDPGSTGGTATGGGSPRGPTPPTATAKFPFPQNRESSHCIYPAAYDNQDVKDVYTAWKSDLVTSDGAGGFRRVKRPAEPGLQVNSTVSEGIAYGMIIAVYMDDQELFDDLWKYSLAHTWTYTPWGGGGSTPTILMNWYIGADGNVTTDGTGAATDADEDMAWALIMADRQWGGSGKLGKSYLDYAKQLLSDIWKYEIDNGRLPKNGSSWGSDKSLNISYFAPGYYRVFAKVTGEARWGKDVVDYVYTVISNNLNGSNGNQDNGLVPAFSQSNGTPAEVSEGQSALAFHYQYDSCRTPFRIGLDACFSGDSRAAAYVAKTSNFFSKIGAANIVDGYELNGTPKPQYPDQYEGRSAAFIGPAGVGAMHSDTFQSFVDDVYDLVRQNNMWCGGQYYDESWTMLSMLMMTANFLDYTQY
jgi:endo-1,4-beta-D-glucanase Y